MSGGANYAQAIEDRGIRCPAKNRRSGDYKCFIYGRTNHVAKDCFPKKRVERQFKNPRRCKRYDRTGHATSNCRVPECNFYKRLGHREATCIKKNNLNGRGHTRNSDDDRYGCICDHFKEQCFRRGTRFQDSGQNVELYTSTGSKLSLVGSAIVDLSLGAIICKHDCVICTNDMKFSADSLSGLDFLSAFKCEISALDRTLSIEKYNFLLRERSVTGNASIITPGAAEKSSLFENTFSETCQSSFPNSEGRQGGKVAIHRQYGTSVEVMRNSGICGGDYVLAQDYVSRIRNEECGTVNYRRGLTTSHAGNDTDICANGSTNA
ncbi:hypothetical protein PR048_001911 [Dryococelus australis]|uniref:Uncharacterized protein n=1 Tax=Dryococelus australis TaxID=614101 RepID=A0ABQ9IIN7_9NEOP|nr:hypothetical protein PR048_001911 [Dryococelus australis]